MKSHPGKQSKAHELQEKLIELFSKQAEVGKMRIFGKLAEGTGDDFSDVDIRIISKDPLITQKNAHRLIEDNIARIMATFTLASDPGCFAEMIMLAGYSPYQKIDISVEREGAGIPFEPITSVYENKNAAGLDRDCDIYTIKKSVDYNLMDVLFGVPRITKCFYRQDFDMYRRWKHQTDALIVLLNEKYTAWQAVSEKKELDAHAAKLLFQRLCAEDKHKLEQILPLNGELKIPISYLSSLQFYVELAMLKANALKVVLDQEFMHFMLKFAQEEVKKVCPRDITLA